MLASARSGVKPRRSAATPDSVVALWTGAKQMLRAVALLAFWAVGALLAGCAGGQVADSVTGQPTPGAGLVRGQVTDVATGKPIVGATVTFRDATGNSGSVTTDESGLYSFDGTAGAAPAAGPVTFQVSALDYFTLTVERTLRYDDGNNQAIENFLLVFGCG